MTAALLIVGVWAFLIVLAFSLAGAAKRGDEMARDALDRERGPHRAKGGGWRL